MNTFRGFLILFVFLVPWSLQAQIISENGNLMGEFLGYLINDMPGEDSEGFVKPDSLQLEQWKRMMDLFVSESFIQAEDSLTTHFSNYEMVQLTDTSFSDAEYYVIREQSPVVYGWGLFAVNPEYQRDVIIAIPHAGFDSYTTQEGVNMFRYLGGRVLSISGTHRCANDEAAISDGTTTVCSSDNSSEDFKVSDMAHFDSSAFQIAHESIKELSTNVFAINLHGHADSDCEDVFLSNGREDDPQTSLQTVRDSLIAYGVDAAMTGDGSSCTLAGTTNVQGRFINGSSNPADDQPASNTGYFFHVEQSGDIRRQFMQYKYVIQAFAELIPRSFNTIDLPELPSIVFNEIHAHPTADANGNGSVQTVSDEFVEIVNAGNESIDLSGWIFKDFSVDRHTIESKTILVPNQPLLLFGGNTPTGDFGGANVQVASSGSLNLSNSGESIYLKTDAQDTVIYVNYPGGYEGESITLSPDLTGTSYTAHTTADSDDNSVYSPGTKINGDPFLTFVEISGDAGWRMLSAPTIDLPIEDISAFTPVQGFGDEFDKNIYTSWDGSSWNAPSSSGDSLENGKGFILYFFDNENAESSTLPVTIRGTGTIPTSDVTIDLHTSGDKWNLIGNPFDSAIDFSDITVNGGELVSNVGYIYNPSISNYVTTTSLGDSVAAWQGIFIKDSTASSITIPVSSQIETADFLKQGSDSKSYIVLELIDEQSKYADELVLNFSESSSVGWDLLDVPDLPSLSATNVSITGKGEKDNKLISQSQFSLPITITEKLKIPLSVTNSTPSNTLFLRVKKKVNIPEQVSIKLSYVDSGNEIEVNSREFGEIIFNESNLSHTLNLEISMASGTFHEPDSELPESFSVSGNYPNPFNPSTNIAYKLPGSSFIHFKVYSVSGVMVYQKEISSQSSGNHSITFDASSFSSGIYLYSFKTKYGTKTGKMILLK